nr:transketolase [Gammaproteobacteria bacterium]
RVVSMPCVERFLRQSSAYQEAVLPKRVSRRVAIEAAVSDSWYRFVGHTGAVIGVDSFGLSAPLDDVFEVLGLTIKRVVEVVQVFFPEKCES